MPTHEEDIIEECRKKTRQQTQTLSSSFESCGVGSQLLYFFALPKMRTLNDVCLSNVGVPISLLLFRKKRFVLDGNVQQNSSPKFRNMKIQIM